MRAARLLYPASHQVYQAPRSLYGLCGLVSELQCFDSPQL
jgi:hypothetical protein